MLFFEVLCISGNTNINKTYVTFWVLCWYFPKWIVNGTLVNAAAQSWDELELTFEMFLHNHESTLPHIEYKQIHAYELLVLSLR